MWTQFLLHMHHDSFEQPEQLPFLCPVPDEWPTDPQHSADQGELVLDMLVSFWLHNIKKIIVILKIQQSYRSIQESFSI